MLGGRAQRCLEVMSLTALWIRGTHLEPDCAQSGNHLLLQSDLTGWPVYPRAVGIVGTGKGGGGARGPSKEMWRGRVEEHE